MMILRWLPEAQNDLERLYEFIKPHSPHAAERAVNTLILAAESLIDFPEKGRLWEADPDFRELTVPFGAKGYVIRYRLHQSQIIIVRLWHGLEFR